MINIPRILVEPGDLFPLTFISEENCSGETLIAELFSTELTAIDDITILYTVSSGSESGGNRGDTIEMILNFSDVESGNYYCKIYTDETGILARGTVIVK